MAYVSSKKNYKRKPSGGYRRRRGATTTSYGRKSKTMDQLVNEKVKRELALSNRGPPRSTTVRLLPCEVNRTIETPVFSPIAGQAWTAYLKGSQADRKYAILPVSELVPSQRGPRSHADDCQRPFDTVRIKGVSVRMTVTHAEGVRLMLFAFRNANRRELGPATVTRPFEIVEDGSEVPREVRYETMTKEMLHGDVLDTEHQSSVRHLGYYDGPFGVLRNKEGAPEWRSQDGTAFTSRLSKEEGRPFGEVFIRQDESKSKKCGRVCNLNLSSSNLMRTFSTTANAIGQSWTASRVRTFEFFIQLNQTERFQSASASRSATERPIELFVGFDGPEPFEIHCSDQESACGMITAMDMAVYYE